MPVRAFGHLGNWRIFRPQVWIFFFKEFPKPVPVPPPSSRWLSVLAPFFSLLCLKTQGAPFSLREIQYAFPWFIVEGARGAVVRPRYCPPEVPD